MNLREILSSYYKEHLSDEEKELFENGKTIIMLEVKMGFDIDTLGPTIDFETKLSKKGIEALAEFSHVEPEEMANAVKKALDNSGYEIAMALSMKGDDDIDVVAKGTGENSSRMADRLNREFAENLNKKGETN